MRRKKDSITGRGKMNKLKDFIRSEKKNQSSQVRKSMSKGKQKLEEKTLEANAKKQKLKNELNEKKTIWDQFKGIRAKILMAFFVPIILMCIFGVVSYQKSSQAIISNYERSSIETLDAVSNYINLGLTSVQEKTIEFILSDNIQSYFLRTNQKDTLDNIKALQKLQEESIIIRETNLFVQNTHIMANVGVGISTATSSPKDIYEQYIATEQAQSIKEDKTRHIWVGSHDFLDEKLSIDKSTYAMSLVSKMSNTDGFIIMDISTSEIMNALSGLDNEDGSIFGFVTSDGRETLTDAEVENVFFDKEYYQTAISSGELSGNSYVEDDGKDYLFSYSKIGETGAVVCSIIPRAVILGQANEIKNLSFVFVGFSSIFAIVIGVIIASGIGNAITKLMKSISLAAKGDLTAKFDTKRKDEFLFLSNGLSDMIAGMSNLIGEVAGVGNKVTDSADLLSSTSETILGATKDISFTIDEIEKGVVQQAEDTELCLGQMSTLSDRINEVYTSTYEIERIANDTKGIVSEGLVIIDELNNKSKATTNVTHMVIKDIEALEVQSHKIVNFVGIINEIAAQTNLLSLNASIEAARAGDAGRGFAVVADEIRKLADQSVNAVSQIQSIVTEIQNKTQGTVVSARQAEDIVGSQTESLNKTIKVFEDINSHVGNLVSNLDDISNGVKGIETAKEDTLDAISNISAVAQQTAAASEEVSATANNQIGSVEDLSKSAMELAIDAKNLEKAIQLFKIN